jgi:predicted alpha/beta hydrolase
MTVAITGGSGSISYQWQASPDGTSGWANASGTGSTAATYTPPSTVAGTTYYRVLINASNNGCDQAVSNVATALIVPDIVVTTQPTNINECVGGTDQMTVVISGGSGTISYQWQSSPTGTGSWSNASGTGSTTATYTPPSTVAGTTHYRVLINATHSGCGQAISNNGIAIIANDIAVTTQPTNVNECVGGTNTMTVAISGGSGTISYQWQSSPNGTGSWTNATGTGALTNTYTPESTTAGTTYYRVLINATNSGCGQAVSNNATAIIAADIVVTTQPTNVNECVGGTDQMTVGITGGSGTISYQWQSRPNGTSSWVNASGAGSTTAM